MHKPLGDLDRLKAMLEKDWGWKDLLVAPHLIPQVQKHPAQGQLGRHRRDPPRHGFLAALHHRRSIPA